ncbi:hypothetical protein AAG906_009328 [Vitis piasezkii]
MEERERARERKIARERESGGDEGSTEIVEGVSHARPGKNVRKGGFGVESKRFEVEVEERRGRLHATIVERKGGISSWVRLGPVSLGIVLDCLILSIEDVRMGRWEREWKENGREYSLTRDYNRGAAFSGWGCGLERKRFSVLFPKEEEQRAAGLQCIKNQKEDVSRSKPNMAKTYMEATKMAKEKERTTVRVEVTKEEVGRNLSKLDHCIVGTWNHNAAKGDDLRGWGTQLARIWRLKGNLGLAKMERGKVLMEFELPAEAEQVSKIGSISFGGLFLRLEKWRPETGCLKEGERSNEAWVRVVGLPVSLWERDILRKIGDACGGFLAVDHQTEKWRSYGHNSWFGLKGPVMVTLWWEIRPVMKFPTTEKKGKAVASGVEVGGDASARARERVTVAMEGSRLEDFLLTADGTQRQSCGSGQPSNPSRSEDGPSGGPHASGGLGLLGQAMLSRWSKASKSPGLTPSGPVLSGSGKPTEKAMPSRLLQGVGPDFQSPSSSASFRAQAEKGLSAAERNRNPLRGPDAAISTFWVKDGQWGLCGDETQWGGISRTDCALLEEDARYDNALSSSGMVALDPPSPFFSSFGRTPLKESFDRSGDLVDSTKGDSLCNGTGSSEQFEGKCWDLALCLVRPISQEESGWVEERWEERGEEEKGYCARKRVPNYGSPMKIRLLSWNVRAMIRNQKVDLFCIQETKIQSMNEGLVRSLGSGRSLDWGALDAQGAAGGILICWDKRTLEILEMEMGQFSISCRLRNVEDGKTWIFTGVYGPFSKEDRETLWGELGAIRGIWDDPWCLGGDFNVTLNLGERSNQGRLTGAMRRFAQVGGWLLGVGEGITKLGLDWTGF